MSQNKTREPDIVNRLSEKGLNGYETGKAYEALEDLYTEGDNNTVETFIEPLSKFDEGDYAGHEPISMLDRKFNELIGRHSGDAEDPVRGYELADDVVDAEDFNDAYNALEEFEDWTDEELDGMLKNTGVVLGDRGQLEDEEYKYAVKFHSLRRVVQQKYEFPESGTFEPNN